MFDRFLRGSSLAADDQGWSGPQFYKTIQLADVDGDGKAELIARDVQGLWTFRFEGGVWARGTPSSGIFSDSGNWHRAQYYSTMRLADVDGDGRAELVARGIEGVWTSRFDRETRRWVSATMTPIFADAHGWDKPQYYSTLRLADVDADGKAELIGRDSKGIWTFHFDAASGRWTDGTHSPICTDAEGWDRLPCYSTLQLADVDGDGRAELVARGTAGVWVHHFDAQRGGWGNTVHTPICTERWDEAKYYTTLRLADIDGDGKAELVARGQDGIWVFHYEAGAGWTRPTLTRICADAKGWGAPQYYSTLRLADIDGDGRAELIARGRAVADVDHDGRAELIGRGASGIVTYKLRGML